MHSFQNLLVFTEQIHEVVLHTNVRPDVNLVSIWVVIENVTSFFTWEKKSAQLKKFYCKLVSEFNPSSVHKMAEYY